MLLSASPALADDDKGGQNGCPPGSWFCADVNETPPGGAPVAEPGDKKGGGKPEAKGEDAASAGGTTIIVNNAPPPAPPPPPPPPPERKPEPKPVAAPPRYEPRPPPPPSPRIRRSEWGFNMRLQGVMMGNRREGRAEDSGMGGLGFALRVRPTGHFALDLGLDFVGGRDYLGNPRTEVPFTINALLFVNPRSVAQFYFLGGLGWSTAHVQRNYDARGDALSPSGAFSKYGYFGLQGGAGVEFRVSRRVGLNLDLIGFIRGRTDDNARRDPEFIDPTTGRATNTSGGGLMRGGVTIYW